MSKSIKGQFHFAINDNFTEGFDKHSYQKENGKGMDNHVPGYTYKFNLLDVARNLGNYLKEEYPEVKQVKDIKVEHIQSFFNYRAETCDDNTLNQYSNAINKLEYVAEKTFKVDLSWKGEYIVPPSIKDGVLSERGVDSVMSREDLETIKSYATENRSQSGDIIRLQDHLGVRVTEITLIKKENIDLEKGTIELKCKGGKELTRQLTPEGVALVKEILAENYHGDKLFSIKPGSVDEYLRDKQDKMGLDRHSFHDIRRLVAQEKYDNWRAEGLSIKEAADKTSIWLNHGKNRDAMLRECYIVLR